MEKQLDDEHSFRFSCSVIGNIFDREKETTWIGNYFDFTKSYVNI